MRVSRGVAERSLPRFSLSAAQRGRDWHDNAAILNLTRAMANDLARRHPAQRRGATRR